jgi:hypothetical protein
MMGEEVNDLGANCVAEPKDLDMVSKRWGPDGADARSLWLAKSATVSVAAVNSSGGAASRPLGAPEGIR